MMQRLLQNYGRIGYVVDDAGIFIFTKIRLVDLSGDRDSDDSKLHFIRAPRPYLNFITDWSFSSLSRNGWTSYTSSHNV